VDVYFHSSVRLRDMVIIYRKLRGNVRLFCLSQARDGAIVDYNQNHVFEKRFHTFFLNTTIVLR
jgi:hypothetical protein